MNRISPVLGLLILFLGSTFFLPACKAKTCDGQNNVSDNGRSKKRVKHSGLFSKREMRRKKW